MPASFTPVVIHPARALRGTLRVPGDKSISHRFALLAALARGTTRISGYAPGADCASTLSALRALGTSIRLEGDQVILSPRPFRTPAGPVDAGNSGTTMRLLAGMMAAQPVDVTLTGDGSLSRRPMRRVIEPLTLMGASIAAADGDRPPLHIRGSELRGIDYTLPVASAQVKSAILLAGLQAHGRTTVREPAPTRDHTERALRTFGATVHQDVGVIALDGPQSLSSGDHQVPGDISSAAFFGVAAAGLPGSDLRVEAVGLNPTRTGWLAVLERAGARIEASIEEGGSGEPRGHLRVSPGGIGPVEIAPDEVPGVIDELPALAALAAFGGELSVAGAAELRVKESDRISGLVNGLRGLGVEADERPDGFVVRGTGRPRGGTADALGDHRLAMAFAIVGLGAEAPSTITGAEAVGVSYPGFFDALEALRA